MRPRLRMHRARGFRRGLARLVSAALGLGIAYYAALALLLALKVDPHTIDTISGYSAAYDRLARLEPGDATARTRLIAGLGGLGTFAVASWLALGLVPRPRVGAAPILLASDDLGHITVAPRAVETAARAAAMQHAAIDGAGARYADGHVEVSVALCRADAVGEALRDVDQAVHAALERCGLPAPTVRVTMTRYRPTTSRELR